MAREFRLLAQLVLDTEVRGDVGRLTCFSSDPDSPPFSRPSSGSSTSERRAFFCGGLKNASIVRFLVFDAILCAMVKCCGETSESGNERKWKTRFAKTSRRVPHFRSKRISNLVSCYHFCQTKAFVQSRLNLAIDSRES